MPKPMHRFSDQAIMAMVNVSYRKVGGLSFLKIGRLTFSWSISKAYRPIGVTA